MKRAFCIPICVSTLQFSTFMDCNFLHHCKRIRESALMEPLTSHVLHVSLLSMRSSKCGGKLPASCSGILVNKSQFRTHTVGVRYGSIILQLYEYDANVHVPIQCKLQMTPKEYHYQFMKHKRHKIIELKSFCIA